jgi:hypothetical protein
MLSCIPTSWSVQMCGWFRPAGAGDIDQDAPHPQGGHREEVRAVLPAHAARVAQAQVSFVDERRGLEGVAGAFAGHVAMGQPV